MSEPLPWDERINAISINPHMATIDDIARMAAELREARDKIAYMEEDADASYWLLYCPICNLSRADYNEIIRAKCTHWKGEGRKEIKRSNNQISGTDTDEVKSDDH